MKKFMLSIIFILSIVNILQAYDSWDMYKKDLNEREKQFWDRLPNPDIHVEPNSKGGYSWIEPYGTNIPGTDLQLPKGHEIEPDGMGGFYIR